MECSSDQHGRMACTCDGLLLLRRRRRRSDRRPVRSAGGRGRRARRIPHAEPGACPATAADLPETHTPCLSPSNNSKERFDLKNINIVKIKQPTNLYKVSFKGTKLAILGALSLYKVGFKGTKLAILGALSLYIYKSKSSSPPTSSSGTGDSLKTLQSRL
jgi:hypothetical protein